MNRKTGSRNRAACAFGIIAAMKTRHEIVIDAPLEEAWAVFDDPERRREWQPTLKSATLEDGVPGQPGAVTQLTVAVRGKDLRLTETISERREPVFLAASYAGSGIGGLVVSHFERVAGHSTRLVVHARYRVTGLNRLTNPFLAAAIGKHTANNLERFKLLVESTA
ncbi:MAG: SRPBCC family protein [Pseudomonadota bacterium]